jgi:serine protease Do
LSTPQRISIVAGVAVGAAVGMVVLLMLILGGADSWHSDFLGKARFWGGRNSSGSVSGRIEDERRNAIVSATQRVSPAVVSVVALRRAANFRRRGELPPGFELLLPGPQRSDALEAYSYGSGFVLHEAGYVLTNEHVIRGADQLVVTLQDGQDLRAELVGQSKDHDLAVLKIAGSVSGMPVAPFGSSERLKIGEWAIAIGSPYGYLMEDTTPTVTVGVISALNRNVKPQSDLSTVYYDMIQTDAAIHPGNSGGPLVNSEGEVIGINTFLLGGEGGNGLGFAVPIDRCLWVMDEILRYGYFRKPYYGMSGVLVSALVARNLNLPANTPPGWLVTEVQQGSPADVAGVRPGDVIITVNAERTGTTQALLRQLHNARVGSEMLLGIWRDPERIDTRITPAEDPFADRS